MTKSKRLKAALVCATMIVSASVAIDPGGAQEAVADLVIRGGTIYRGNAEPFHGDIAIRGDRIVYVGPKAPAR